MHYPKVMLAAKDDRSHTIAEVSLRAQNAESLYAISRSEIAYKLNIHPLARNAGEGSTALIPDPSPASRRREQAAIIKAIP